MTPLRAICLGVVLILTGCGWNTGLVAPASSTGRGVGSVGVELFATDRERVLERDLEPRLHAELSRAVADFVDAPLVSPEEADIVVRGRILEVRRRGGIRRSATQVRTLPGGAPAPESRFDLIETGLRIVVQAELVDRRTGETIGTPETASTWSGFAVSPAEEFAARERVLANLAQRLVLELFTPREGAEPAGSNPR